MVQSEAQKRAKAKYYLNWEKTFNIWKKLQEDKKNFGWYFVFPWKIRFSSISANFVHKLKFSSIKRHFSSINANLVHKLQFSSIKGFSTINANLVHKPTFFIHKYGTQDLPMFPTNPDLRTLLRTFLLMFRRSYVPPRPRLVPRLFLPCCYFHR